MANYTKQLLRSRMAIQALREAAKRSAQLRAQAEARGPSCDICGAVESGGEAIWTVKSAGTVTGRYCGAHLPEAGGW